MYLPRIKVRMATVIKVTDSCVPSDVSSKTHHVLSKAGKLVRFRNTYDSWDKAHDSSTVLPGVLKIIRQGPILYRSHSFDMLTLDKPPTEWETWTNAQSSPLTSASPGAHFHH